MHSWVRVPPWYNYLPRRMRAPERERGNTIPPGSSMQEVEWQLDAVDLRPVERWLQSRQAAHHSEGGEAGALAAAQSTTDIAYRPQGPRAIADTYFDTADWRLHRAGLTLRLRSENGAHAVTMKTTEAAVDGLRIRTEIEDPLPSSDLQSLLTSEGRAGAWVRALTGSQPLRPLFSLQSTRQAYAIRKAA